jgi:hypothetical protein
MQEGDAEGVFSGTQLRYQARANFSAVERKSRNAARQCGTATPNSERKSMKREEWVDLSAQGHTERQPPREAVTRRVPAPLSSPRIAMRPL